MEDMHVQYITYLIMYPDCKADRAPFQGFLSLKTDHNQHLFSSIQIQEQKSQCAHLLYSIFYSVLSCSSSNSSTVLYYWSSN